MPSEYVTVDTGFTESRTRWAVRLRDGRRFTVAIGTFSVTFTDEQRDRFAEAVARAAMPGQAVKHGPGCHCTPCLAEPSYEGRREAGRRDGHRQEAG